MASQGTQGSNLAPPDDDTFDDDDDGPVGAAARSISPAMATVAVAFALLIGWGMCSYMLQNSPEPLPMGPIVANQAHSSQADSPTDSSHENVTDDGGAGASDSFRGKTSGRRSSSRAAGRMLVQVAGRVNAPGVIALGPDSRVSDALTAAGGVTTDGDSSGMNLAAKVTDGQRIDVPVKQQPLAQTTQSVPSALATASQVESAIASPTSVPTAAGVAAPTPNIASARQSSSVKGKGKTGKRSREELLASPVNISTATVEELATLPGVGSGMATRIVNFRQQNGGFQSVEDLDRVPGIGEKKMDALRQLVTVY